MKKKHFKLLTTMASLLLVVSVMAVGIWAATLQTFKLTSSISFTATGVSAKVFAKIGGDADTGAKIDTLTLTDTFAQLYDYTSDEADDVGDNDDIFSFTFKDTSGDAKISEEETVTLTLLIVNTSNEGVAMNYKAVPKITADSSKIQIQSASIQVGTVVATTAEPLTLGDISLTGEAVSLGDKTNTVSATPLNAVTVQNEAALNCVQITIVLTTTEAITSLNGDAGFNLDVSLSSGELTADAKNPFFNQSEESFEDPAVKNLPASQDPDADPEEGA